MWGPHFQSPVAAPASLRSKPQAPSHSCCFQPSAQGLCLSPGLALPLPPPPHRGASRHMLGRLLASLRPVFNCHLHEASLRLPKPCPASSGPPTPQRPCVSLHCDAQSQHPEPGRDERLHPRSTLLCQATSLGLSSHQPLLSCPPAPLQPPQPISTRDLTHLLLGRCGASTGPHSCLSGVPASYQASPRWPRVGQVGQHSLEQDSPNEPVEDCGYQLMAPVGLSGSPCGPFMKDSRAVKAQGAGWPC